MSNDTLETPRATTASSQVKNRQPRRWWQFKLRTLFLLLALAAIVVSAGMYYARQAEAQKDFVAWVRKGDRKWLHYQEDPIEYHRSGLNFISIREWLAEQYGPDYAWPLKSVNRNMSDTKVVDLQPFANCNQLETLTLVYPEVSDWIALEQLSTLKSLQIYFLQLSHVKNIGRCRKLTDLRLESSEYLLDISGIEGLVDLERLTVDAPHLENIEVLSKLPKLSDLCMRGNKKLDFRPLQKCTELQDVLLWNTNIDDLDYLANSSRMKTLRIGGDSLKSIAAIEKLKNLEYLQLNYSQLQDFSVLASCTKLRKLDLHRNPISDITALQACREIEELNLAETNISDLSPLKNMTELKILEIYSTKVTDLNPLSDCVNLKSLTLSQTKVSDLSALVKCQKLTKLDIRGTAVINLEPLKSLPTLKLLLLGDEQFAKYSASELTQMFPNCKIHFPRTATTPRTNGRNVVGRADNN